MRKLLMVLLLIPLSGCFYQAVTGYEADLAIRWCADKSGVAYIRSYANGDTRVFCMQRKKDSIRSQRINAKVDDIEKAYLSRK